MIDLALQLVITVMSSLTAAAALWMVKRAAAFLERMEQTEERSERNEQRSKANRTVLRREGMIRRSPVASGGNIDD